MQLFCSWTHKNPVRKPHISSVSSCGANTVLRNKMQWHWPSCVPGRARRTRTGINTFPCGCKKGRNLIHRCHCSFSIKMLIDLHVRIQLFGLICHNGNTEDNTPEHSRILASFPTENCNPNAFLLLHPECTIYTGEEMCPCEMYSDFRCLAVTFYILLNKLLPRVLS